MYEKKTNKMFFINFVRIIFLTPQSQSAYRNILLKPMSDKRHCRSN